MKVDFLENLKDVVNVQVETDKDSVKSLLNDHKFVVTITKGPKILTKMVKVAGTKKSAGPRVSVSEETRTRIKTQRILLKNNVDAMYVFTLIEKTKDHIKKINLKDMTKEAREMFNTEIGALIDNLASTQKLLLIGRKAK